MDDHSVAGLGSSVNDRDSRGGHGIENIEVVQQYVAGGGERTTRSLLFTRSWSAYTGVPDTTCRATKSPAVTRTWVWGRTVVLIVGVVVRY